jgi:hypothetical protein
MTSRNWNRPSFQIRGRECESICGDDLSRLARRPPMRSQPTKAELRRQGELAVQEWRRKQRETPKP